MLDTDRDRIIEPVGIRWPAWWRQGLDFSGLPIALSDLDGIVDLWGRAFAILEVKRAGVPLPRGQELLLERLADALARGGKRTVLLHATHHEENPDAVVPLAACHVVRFRWSAHPWIEPDVPVSVNAWMYYLAARFRPPRNR